MKRQSVWLVLSVWVMAAGLLAQEMDKALQKGDKLPALTLKHEDGKDFALAERMKEKEAKGALLVVWSEHCPVCTQAMPDLEKTHQLAKKNKVLFYGINVDEGVGKEELAQYREQKQVTFTSALDPQREIARKLGVQSTPTVYLIGQDQQVQAIYQGYTTDIASAMQRDLSEYVVAGTVTGPAPQAAMG